MELTTLTPKQYKEWDKFCLESDDAWFWHTSLWLEYTINYRPELQPESKSFIMSLNNKIVGICPLVLETHDTVKEFSFGGAYGPTPALQNGVTKKQRDKMGKQAYQEIDRLAQENKVKRVRLKCSILNKSFIEAPKQQYNYLMKFGYLDTSINTQILDLSKSLEELRRDIRHGHDADIDRSSKFLKAEIYDKTNITKEIFEEYIQMHHRAAGRITRPRITFDLMHDRIKHGEAFLIGATKEKKFVGFSYFNAYKNNVYYSSSCNEPGETLPVAHFIQWAAIQWMKENNIHFYEIGWQVYKNTMTDFYSKKEVHIGRFKRGFGGFTVPLFMAEKYYDKNYFLAMYKERIKQYTEYLEEG
jgi:hypothetical protein